MNLAKRLAAIALLALGLLGVASGPSEATKIERVVGASGVEAWLVTDRSVPIVTLRFAFAGGANLDPVGKEGTAAMAAALLDEGAGPYDGIAYRRRLDELAGELSFSAGHDEFNGTLRSLKQNLSETAELLRVALSEPHFAADTVERIRGETLAYLARQARNPRSLASRLWMRDAFEHHPYGNDATGSATSVAAIGRDDVVGLAASQFRRGGLVIGAVGDITATELATVIDLVFGSLPQGGADTVIPDVTPADAGALVVSRTTVPQSAVTFGQVGLKRDDPDWYTALILNEIMGGGGFRGRLMKEIREKRGLAYGVSTDLVPYRHAGLILGSVATENSRVAESIALIRQEWQRMRDDGPTEDDLRDAQTYLTGSFPLGLDSTRRIAGLLVRIQQERLGIDYLDRRAELINSVTLEQARNLAKRLYDPARLSFTIVGDPAGLQTARPARDQAPSGTPARAP
jgi:zinc protease